MDRNIKEKEQNYIENKILFMFDICEREEITIKKNEYDCDRACEELEYYLNHGLLSVKRIEDILNKYSLYPNQRQFLKVIYTKRLVRLNFYKDYKKIRKIVIKRKLSLNQLEILMNNVNIDEEHKTRMFERLKGLVK